MTLGVPGVRGARPALAPGLPRELRPSPALRGPSVWILSLCLGEAPPGHIPAHPSPSQWMQHPPPGRGTGPWNVPSQGRGRAWGRSLRSTVPAQWDPGRSHHPSWPLVAIPSSRGLGFTGSSWSDWGCCSPAPAPWAGASRDGDLHLPELSWSCCCPFHPSIPPFPRDFQLWLLQHQPQLMTGEPGIHPGFHPRIPLLDSSPSHPAGALGQPCHCFPKFPLEEAPRGDEEGTALSWLPRLRLLWFLLGEELGCGNPSLNSQLPGKRGNVISLLLSHPSSGNFPGWDFHGT